MTLALHKAFPAFGTQRGPALDACPPAEDLWEVDSLAIAARLATCTLTQEVFFQASYTTPGGPERDKRRTTVFRVQVVCTATGHDTAHPDLAGQVNRQLESLARRYVGQYLNDLPPFRGAEPTVARLAAVLSVQLERQLADLPVTIDLITVYESPTQSATCRCAPAHEGARVVGLPGSR